MKAAHALLLGVYGGLWLAATPFLRRHRRLGDGFADRLVPPGWPWTAGNSAGTSGFSSEDQASLRIWIQAASGGEAWLVHSLLPALTRALTASPDFSGRPCRLLCTTCTRQGLTVLEKLVSPPADAAAGPLVVPRYFPLDRPSLMRRAMSQAAPHLVLLLETELWPGLLEAAKKRGVPVLAANARMTEKSASAYGLLPSFWRQYAPREVLAVSEEDAGRFAALFGPSTAVSVMPNIKFDRVAETPATEDEPAAAALRRSAGLPDSALLVALASVREEEEELLLPAIRALLGQRVRGAPVALAVAPRHMHRVPAWAERLRRSAFPFARRSSGMTFSPAGQSVGPSVGPSTDSGAAPLSGPPPGKDAVLPVCLWDTFGELRTLYAAADAAFVGGSLAPAGGQNFLEALGQGLRPVVGPYGENFRWVGDELFSLGLVQRITGPDALPRALLKTLEEAAPGCAEEDGDGRARARRLVRERFANWLARHTGGSDMAARAVLAALRERLPGRQVWREEKKGSSGKYIDK